MTGREAAFHVLITPIGGQASLCPPQGTALEWYWWIDEAKDVLADQTR